MQGELIIRLDDVRDLSPRLVAVWDVLERHGAAVHLGAIPIDVHEGAAARLLERAARSGSRVSVQQHGYRHVNHGQGKRKFERGFEEQRADLAAGQRILTDMFGPLFDGVFVPPFDRCGALGMQALAELGFVGISVIETSSAPRDPRVPQVLMTVDPVDWKASTHRPWDQTTQALGERLERDGYAGLELHHEVMDEAAVNGLDRLLEQLRGVHYPTMHEAALRQKQPG